MSIYFHNLMVSNTTRNQHRDCNTSSLPRSRKAARHHRQRQKWCRPLIALFHMHHPLEVRYRLLMYVGPILLVSIFYSNLSKISPSPPSIFTPGPYISPEEQATWNEYNPMEVPGVKQSPAETSIYTRKQVEDMLNVVGNCFLETIVSWFNIDRETHSLSLVSKGCRPSENTSSWLALWARHPRIANPCWITRGLVEHQRRSAKDDFDGDNS